MIKFLRHSQIDKNKWDACIANAGVPFVYATAWYLDCVSPHWAALVEDDYKYIMPLPWKQKLGLRYIVQPCFTQQLGIFGANEPNTEKVKSFFKAIPFWFFRIRLNFYHQLPYKTIERVNIELDLNRSFDEIKKNFNENTRRNIKKAALNKCQIAFSTIESNFLEYYINENNSNLSKNEQIVINKIVKKSLELKYGYIIIVTNEKKEIIASAFFVKELNRIIYIASFSTKEGFEKSAMFLLISQTIERFSENEMIFDFEGSMLPSIARFFKGFGGVEKKYYQIQ